jgi:hypothetical protein
MEYLEANANHRYYMHIVSSLNPPPIFKASESGARMEIQMRWLMKLLQDMKYFLKVPFLSTWSFAKLGSYATTECLSWRRK